VPRFHLRGFANENQMLRQIDLQTGTYRNVSIGDAAVIKDFYTVELEDGTRSDEWEKRFAEVENRVAPRVRRAVRDEVWTPSAVERQDLSTWIALQFLRGPDHRRMAAQTAGFMMRMQVGMGGLAYLQYAMEQGLEREVSLEEAEGAWADIHRPAGPELKLSGTDFMSTITSSLAQVIEFISARSWHRARFQRRTLAINDSPVALIPDENHPPFLGVGLNNAAAITIALDRHTLLWLADPAMADFDFPPTVQLARAHNRSTIFGADRFVYTHPKDADPTEGLPLPRPARKMSEPTGMSGMENRDRELADVLEQIATYDRRDDPNSMIADYAWPFPGYVPPANSAG